VTHPLDTPVWSALTTRQAGFDPEGRLARRFPPDVGPLAGVRDGSAEAVAELLSRLPAGDEVSLMEVAPPEAPAGIVATHAAVLQMIAASMPAPDGGPEPAPLGDADAAEMLELALLTRPGPFRARTHTVGRFLGIRDGARLVAMAGDRLKLDGFVEISGVCTHPDYRGRGYGEALMRAVGARILAEGDKPILHTYASNTGAIALYRKLGFEVRREMVHAVWKRAV
jgi:ribosomal protein S18 acetylase RimI-like enzyme